MYAAKDNEWEKFEKLPAWQMTKVRRTVHFATLMDICHLQNAESEPKFQKYTGRVVLRGEREKDGSGSYAPPGCVNKYVTELPEENKKLVHCEEMAPCAGRLVAMKQKEQLTPFSS